MWHILIFSIFFVVLVLFDLVPSFRRKDRRCLYFSLPAYLLALVLNLWIGSGWNYQSIARLVQEAAVKFFR